MLQPFAPKMSTEPKINVPEIVPASSASRSEGVPAASSEPTDAARLSEIERTMRELLALRRAEKRDGGISKLALLALALAFAALLCSAAPAYFSWLAYTRTSEPPREIPAPVATIAPPEPAAPADLRAQLTLSELAKRSPSIRAGNLQAWWAGEQARQVQRLEAQAKRQTLAGDREGAARSVNRADEIRSGIATLADFEKPPAK